MAAFDSESAGDDIVFHKIFHWCSRKRNIHDHRMRLWDSSNKLSLENRRSVAHEIVEAQSTRRPEQTVTVDSKTTVLAVKNSSLENTPVQVGPHRKGRPPLFGMDCRAVIIALLERNPNLRWPELRQQINASHPQFMSTMNSVPTRRGFTYCLHLSRQIRKRSTRQENILEIEPADAQAKATFRNVSSRGKRCAVVRGKSKRSVASQFP